MTRGLNIFPANIDHVTNQRSHSKYKKETVKENKHHGLHHANLQQRPQPLRAVRTLGMAYAHARLYLRPRTAAPGIPPAELVSGLVPRSKVPNRPVPNHGALHHVQEGGAVRRRCHGGQDPRRRDAVRGQRAGAAGRELRWKQVAAGRARGGGDGELVQVLAGEGVQGGVAGDGRERAGGIESRG